MKTLTTIFALTAAFLAVSAHANDRASLNPDQVLILMEASLNANPPVAAAKVAALPASEVEQGPVVELDRDNMPVPLHPERAKSNHPVVPFIGIGATAGTTSGINVEAGIFVALTCNVSAELSINAAKTNAQPSNTAGQVDNKVKSFGYGGEAVLRYQPAAWGRWAIRGGALAGEVQETTETGTLSPGQLKQTTVVTTKNRVVPVLGVDRTIYFGTQFRLDVTVEKSPQVSAGFRFGF